MPKKKRKYGYYALPVLHRNALIGRMDAHFEREQARLRVNRFYPEGGEPLAKAASRAVKAEIEALGIFLGARTVDYIQRPG